MEVTQAYARPSQASAEADGMKFNFSAEMSRPPVSINALIKNSLSYARLMLALRQVVKGDWRTPQKDNTAYQEWVMERYMEELPEHMQHIEAEKVKLLEKRESLKAKQKNLRTAIKPIQTQVSTARRDYYNWLYKNDREKWIVLDPVVSVHPDSVIFEAFSLDESSYGRVSVPMVQLETFEDVKYGTTNIDFSQLLADELYRVRSYRPAWLNVAFEKVELSTAAGTALEKKIDLPESWVRGFLQVQSASTLEGIDLKIHSQTLSNVLYELERKKEKESPRSIRFVLKPNEPITILIDPWNIEIKDAYVYKGEEEKEIRLWGRRRLFVMKELLPYTDIVNIKLLGTGMPSYWTIQMGGHRFDLGLSGWTANDWAKKGNFDLLASTGSGKNIDIKKVEQVLIQKLSVTPNDVAEALNIKRSSATYALQELAKQGQAMYDHLTETYRWRKLLSQNIKLTESEEDERLKYAVSLIKEGKVEILEQSIEEGGVQGFKVGVQGKNFYKPEIKVDLDGRIKHAQCTCSFFRRNKLRQGPCAHIMAAVVHVSKQG